MRTAPVATLAPSGRKAVFYTSLSSGDRNAEFDTIREFTSMERIKNFGGTLDFLVSYSCTSSFTLHATLYRRPLMRQVGPGKLTTNGNAVIPEYEIVPQPTSARNIPSAMIFTSASFDLMPGQQRVEHFWRDFTYRIKKKKNPLARLHGIKKVGKKKSKRATAYVDFYPYEDSITLVLSLVEPSIATSLTTGQPAQQQNFPLTVDVLVIVKY